MIVAKYKFNPSTYADLLPEFDYGYSYTKSDTTNSDGTITRTINSDSLPTVMRFGERVNASNKSRSLLEILSMNTSNITDMSYMFRYCENLTSVICDWNTSQATTMSHMFANCSNLLQLDVSNWNTSKTNQMQYIFGMCISLSSLNVSNWDTSQVTNMEGVFNNCSSLTSLDVSNWNTSNVTTMVSLFRMCSSLTSLDLNNWNTSKVTDLTNTFKECKALTQLDINNWDTSKVTNMTETFKTCSSLTSLDLGNWNTSNVTQMSTTFRECKVLTQLNISNWDVSKLNNTYAMFHSCSSLTSLDLSNWNTVKLDNSQYMFGGCSSLKTLDISNWNTDKISNMTYMFQDARSLYKVNLKYANNSTVSKIHENLPDRTDTTKGYILASVDLISNKNWHRIKSSHNNFYLPQPLRKVGDVKDRLYWDENKGHYCIEQHITSTLEVLGTPNIIDLPYLNQKLTFDSYNPSTTIDIPNRPLKASKTYLDSPIARYRYTGLQPSTQYNVQFDCKGDSGIKVNLGGTEVTFTPTSNWTRKNLPITTPSELVNDKLSISNVGITSNNKVDNVMLFTEVIAQEPDYIDSIQSIGELQDNGTYKIDIITHNGVKNLVNTNPNNWIEKDSDSVIVKSSIKTEKGKAYTVFNSMGQWVAIYESDLDGNQYNLIKQDNIGNWSFIATSEYIKVSLWGISHISDKLSQPHNMNVRIFEGYNDYGYNEYEERKLSTQSIYLPQPLRKRGNAKDKFYWDDDKGHYCIEKNVAKVIFDGSDDEGWMKNAFTSDTDARNCYCATGVKVYPTYSMSSSDVLFDKLTWRNANSWGDTSSYIEDEFLISDNKFYVFKSSIKTLDEFKQWISQNPITLIHPLETPNIIDLPEMNKKLSYDTYLPDTSIKVTNLPLQPYGLQLEDDTVRYKFTIEPSTLYTIQFNCLAKSTTNLTLDLGGTRKTVDPIIGVNHVQITTPSVLVSDRLFLIGTGIVIKEVIVNKGNMNQYPKYFDGEQSVGELQEDGSYIIRISTDNYTNLWEGDL